ncbi:MAG: TolC family protein [Bdellovibrionota bacterium]
MRAPILPTLLLLALIFPKTAAAETLSFEELWDRIRDRSAAVEAGGNGADAATLAAERADRHWYPKLLLDTRAYATNDAGLTFFSLLGERRATAADFAPSPLNHPGSELFEKGSLILDFPLYEGGQKEVLADSAKLAAVAKATERDAALQAEFAQTVLAYALILSNKSEDKELSKLAGQVDELLRRYQLGSKSNPVGYAGALGLKSLRARLSGLLERSKATQKSLIAGLSIRAEINPEAWEPKEESFTQLINDALGKAGETQEAGSSLQARAMLEGAAAAERAAAAEKARFLPRAGLFAQGDLTNGDRATDGSYTAGAYLQWNLFDAPSYGAHRQAGLEAAALRLQAKHQAQDDRIARAQAREAILAIEANLKLLQESLDLSGEQIQTSETLFRNGSINALQLAEVLSRRTDLILAKSQAESQWIETSIQNFLRSGVLPRSAS